MEEREARVSPNGASETALLRGWLLWQAGDWPGAEKQWGKTNTGLSQALFDGGREQHKGEKSKTVEAIHPPLTQADSSSTLAPSAVTAQRGSDIAWLQNMLLKHNPKLTPEQVTVQILDGKMVRLEIISLYARDISSVSGLTDLQAFVCVAFKSDENNDSAKSAPIEDLTPLMNLPLQSLNIKQTAVQDLTPILNSPIERIWLDFSPFKRRRETDRGFCVVLCRMHSLKFIHFVNPLKQKHFVTH